MVCALLAKYYYIRMRNSIFIFLFCNFTIKIKLKYKNDIFNFKILFDKNLIKHYCWPVKLSRIRVFFFSLDLSYSTEKKCVSALYNW